MNLQDNGTKKLRYLSDYINVTIADYKSSRFSFNGWTLYDRYDTSNSANPQYQIIIEHSIDNIGSLNELAFDAKKICKIISLFTPYTCLTALYYDHKEISGRTVIIDTPNSYIKGWQSNYSTIQCELENPQQRFRVNVDANRFSKLQSSPLEEIYDMLNKYDGIDDYIRYLMIYHYYANFNESIIMYALYGKVLEIIDSIYPKYSNRNDKRIKDYFPEIANKYPNITIKELFNWANNRLETRHTINEKSKQRLHKPLSKEEAQQYYEVTNLLTIMIVREKFNLEKIDIHNE